MNKWLLSAALVLILNSAYLAVAGDPWFFYFGNVLLHLGLGLVLLVPFTWWLWARRKQPAVLVSGLALLVGTHHLVGAGARRPAAGPSR